MRTVVSFHSSEVAKIIEALSHPKVRSIRKRLSDAMTETPDGVLQLIADDPEEVDEEELFNPNHM